MSLHAVDTKPAARPQYRFPLLLRLRTTTTTSTTTTTHLVHSKGERLHVLLEPTHLLVHLTQLLDDAPPTVHIPTTTTTTTTTTGAATPTRTPGLGESGADVDVVLEHQQVVGIVVLLLVLLLRQCVRRR